ncbi:hypothetical protein [Providencia stuartii]|uniref:hypothetical protein n=1 Tax=Providencia stuartii TaxID=588 RepID=UPI0024AAF8BE|nr:hypothetical protein [Providencia stuartii]MCX3072556.1 hypothetical protein [Providencia stuartii]
MKKIIGFLCMSVSISSFGYDVNGIDIENDKKEQVIKKIQGINQGFKFKELPKGANNYSAFNAILHTDESITSFLASFDDDDNLIYINKEEVFNDGNHISEEKFRNKLIEKYGDDFNENSYGSTTDNSIKWAKGLSYEDASKLNKYECSITNGYISAFSTIGSVKGKIRTTEIDKPIFISGLNPSCDYNINVNYINGIAREKDSDYNTIYGTIKSYNIVLINTKREINNQVNNQQKQKDALNKKLKEEADKIKNAKDVNI